MKLYENVVDYKISKHGNAYIDPNAIAVVCPECCSVNLTRTDETSTSFRCNDCGCEFRPHAYKRMTKFGKFISKLLLILTIIFTIGAVAAFIGGIIYISIVDGETSGGIPDNDLQVGLFIMVVIPIICGGLAKICGLIEGFVCS